jgi:hypothetical protein
LDIVALFLWIFTAAAGLRLLAGGKHAQDPVPPAGSGTVPAATAPVPAGAAPTSKAGASAGALASSGGPALAGVPAAAAAAAGAGKLPPITRTRIGTGPGEHPLLEFMHPALGISGLGCWIAFVITRSGAFAWGAFAVIVVTAAAGLTWVISTTRAARRRGGDHRPPFPPRLITLHGSAAALTLILAVLTALTVTHV